MNKPMISVSGIRGTVGGSLVPEEFVKFAAAFASTLSERTVVVGCDTRPSRDMLRHLVFGACEAAGCRVVDLGVVPTPTVGLMTAHLGAGGGIAITASHNPVEWNALKFFSHRGTFLSESEMAGVLERYERGAFDYREVGGIGAVETVDDPLGPHLERVTGAVDVERIRAAELPVALDLCNGAGIGLLLRLLTRLGCRTSTVFADPFKPFERVPEPLPENLGVLGAKVRLSRAAVGFAVDPDADRLALVDETGRAIGEERTLTLVARHVLGKASRATPIVANLSTTRALDDVAAEFGTHVVRTRIGEANVVERMLESGAVIGGEGNGGVIYPAVHPGRDAATGIALILEAMVSEGKSLSELNGEVPDYAMVKRKAGIEGKETEGIYARLREAFGEASGFDETDGLKIVFEDRWVHVRPSGTEPVLRVFAEARTAEEAGSLAEKAMDIAGL